MMYPDYQPVTDPTRREKFSDFWGAELDPNAGLTVVEVMNAAHEGAIKGMYIMGENPAMSDPNLRHVREALASLDHLVVQELFLTETACYADVVLAGLRVAREGRHGHQHQPPGPDGPHCPHNA